MVTHSSSLHENTPFWKYFTPAEQSALRDSSPHDLAPEIMLLTAGQIQLLENEQRAPTHDHNLQAENIKALGDAAVCIGSMKRIRFKLQGRKSRWHPVIQAAYKLARQQMDVENYLNIS